jgi:2-keto-4-pentenoate hydratase/2-oxohepta-3-ene-1,7-dioic acid hydratase in catechol pathway
LKLVTFEVKTPVGVFTRIGALSFDRIVDLRTAYASYLFYDKAEDDAYAIADFTIPLDMIEYLKRGNSAREASEKALDFVQVSLKKERGLKGPNDERITYSRQEVKLLAPIPKPTHMRDLMGFLKHYETMLKRRGKAVPEVFYDVPIYHKCNTNLVAGPDDPILWPSYTNKLDYEFEYAMCIGKKGTDIPSSKAVEYIAGYTILNDLSARDRQKAEMESNMGPAKGKDFNNGYIMGPCLVTADELHHKIRNLRMIAKINDEVVTDGNTGTMQFTWEEIIEYCSQDETLHPGEVFGSGAVGGGCGSENDKWIKPGDTVEFEIEGIGVLRNKVVKAKDTKLWKGRY